MKDKHLQIFLVEASEILEEIEQTMLELEDNLDDSELIGRAFRALHTMKGSSSMFGYDRISSFLHKVENVYDLVRNNELQLNKNIISLTLKARDIIKNIFDNVEVSDDEMQVIISQFGNYLTQPKEEILSTNNESEESSSTNQNKNFRIIFSPNPNIFMTGTNPLFIIREISELGQLNIQTKNSIPILSDLDPTQCYTEWELELSTTKDSNYIKDIFMFVEDDCKLEISEIDSNIDSNNSISQTNDNSIIPTENIDQNTLIKKTSEPNQASKVKIESIRVNSDKLDELVNLVGELVIVQARLAQTAVKHNLLDLSSISEEVERLTWNLRDSTLNLRMLAIGTTFDKFKRLVRDLSMDLNKEVELTTIGGETEIDKTVIEKLNDPMVHIIRNSIDHGIETPDIRVQNNKMASGKINLSASQSGGYVFIKISDDGAGLNKDRIRQKAIEKGLVQADKEYTDQEIFNFVFLPGFSTAASITSVSGRGVGMDVVKKSIESLRGTVEIDSILGQGTTVTCKLPLTLAIIEGLLVRVENEYFVIPLSQVEECVESKSQRIFSKNGRSLIEVRENLIPFISLHKVFGLNQNVNELEQVVIIKDSEYKIGITVDEIIGEQQVVIKSMGNVFKSVETISGATILGDGSVALIIDVLKLIQIVENSEHILTKV